MTDVTERLHVLLVDDDVDHALVARRTLERQGGFTVRHVTDANACLDALTHGSYAVVLLDYSLPGTNGLEVLARIRERCADVPVVMATGQGDERIAIQAMHAGAIDYVVKTSGYFATLPTVVNKVLKQHELALDNARLYAESQRQQARLGQIFESTSDGIVLADGEGVIVFANRRAGELLRFDPVYAGGQRLPALVRAACGAHASASMPAFEALFASRADEGDGDLEMADGQRVLHWIGQPTDDGELRGFTITFHDVTREREVSRMKSDFVSFVAHQLRTPLSGIKWMLEVAGEEPGLSEATVSCIADAAAAADRLIGMVSDLLDTSRLEAGGLQLTLTPIDLGALTRAVITEVAPEVAKKAHGVEVSGDEQSLVVIADEQLLRQAMLNVIGNAIKYTPEGGKIALALSAENGRVSWMVRDNGVGIPKSSQARLFEKFYRADNASAIDTNGRGLGLYMVRLIVTRLGGQIQWESEEGQGTTFGFVLPQGGH